MVPLNFLLRQTTGARASSEGQRKQITQMNRDLYTPDSLAWLVEQLSRLLFTPSIGAQVPLLQPIGLSLVAGKKKLYRQL